MTLVGAATQPTAIALARRRPPARNDRWQPTRAGLVSLWRYWDETLEFHDGRLLLRGPNGSGKSMALELLLPFLLDGETSPHKLSSATRQRGTLFDRVMAGATEATRAGFAWIEFRRGDETFTIGARIRASHATHRAERQLFTTTLRVGDELHLLDSRRGAISRRELTDAVGATGRVTESATEHRDAVRRVLFPTFGVERYDSLIGALLSLRREKLSQNLDLAKLSAVLSEALPPLDDHDIAEVAEGFERLDRRRHEIELLATDLEQVDALVQRQRRYARSVLAGVAGEVVSAESARDTVVRDRRLAGAELDALDTELATLVAEDESLRRRVTDIDDELRGIRESALYREGAQLAELRGELKKRSEERDGLAHSVERLAEGLGEAIAERDRADEDVATAAANLDRAWAALAVLADRVGARSVVPPEGAPSGGPSPADHRAALAAWVADRHSAVESVGDALTAHKQAVRDHRGAEDRLDAARQRSEQRTVERDVRVRAASEAVEVYVGSVGSWAEDTVLTGDERLAIDAARHGEDPPDEVDAAVALLRGDRREAAAVAHRDLAARREVVQEERSRLVAERDTLEAGVAPTPVAPPWRRHRDAVGGGPLWRLVDVVDGVPGPVVDAVESAMVAAGLADAWVAPGGSIELGPDDADVVLTAAGPSAEAAGTLTEVLTPVIGTLDEAPVPAVVVAGVLRSIRLVADPVTLGGDDVAIGRNAMYRLGAAVGRGRRVTATLFGATARERHLLAEIDRLSGEIVTSDQVLADVEHRDRAVAAGLAAFDAVMADRPPRRQVDDARSASREAETRLDEATRRAEDARAEVVEAETAVRSAQRRLATECSRTGLPGRRAELDEYRAEVDLLDEGAGTWSRRAEEASTAAEALARTDRSAQRAAGAHADGAERWRQVDLEARSLTTRVAAISSSLGSDLDDLLAMGEVLVDERGSGTDRLDEIRVVRPPLDVRRGELRQGVVEAETALSEVEARRSRAHGGVTRLASGPLLADAAVDVGVTALEGVTAVLAAARAIASAVANDPADQVDRRSRAVEELLHTVRTLLAGRIDLAREQPDGADWLVLMGSSGGVRRTLGDLVARLMLDLGAARSELAAEEAELFERTLAGSIRSSLAERIRAANALVDTINARLDEVRTAAGVGVRLRWAVDDEQPPAVRAARSLLLRDPADLSDEERGALSDFVRARVDEARRDVEVHAPWELRLRESLDYRQWHSFGLQVSHRDWQGFKPATGNLLQRLSTGERSVALHLPMLASIAVHYADGQGGHLDGPRLILLDELFAGVDESNRAQLFGTFTAWDLDAVLTSDHEWCQYSTLAGIAIHHLQGRRDDEPVTSVRFVWDGRERVLDAGTG